MLDLKKIASEIIKRKPTTDADVIVIFKEFGAEVPEGVDLSVPPDTASGEEIVADEMEDGASMDLTLPLEDLREQSITKMLDKKSKDKPKDKPKDMPF